MKKYESRNCTTLPRKKITILKNISKCNFYSMTNLVITTQERILPLSYEAVSFSTSDCGLIQSYTLVDNLCLLNGAYKGQKINKVLQF